MTKLNQLSYKEFGKLRFLDFFPKTAEYDEEHEGGLESGIGLSCSEGYAPFFTMFMSPADQPWQTAEMNLDFENGCPEAPGNELLSRFGLGIRKGMSPAQVREACGIPTEETLIYMRFVVGEKWQYYVDCFLKERQGLFKVWICRKDLADEQIE